jgi:hypothetical protein
MLHCTFVNICRLVPVPPDIACFGYVGDERVVADPGEPCASPIALSVVRTIRRWGQQESLRQVAGFSRGFRPLLSSSHFFFDSVHLFHIICRGLRDWR